MAQGVHIAKARVKDYLVANLDRFCTGIETEEALNPGDVAFPRLYVQGPEQEPADVPGATNKDFPAIFVDGTTSPLRRSQQQVAGGRSYEVTYNIRLLAWCRRDNPRERSLVVLDRDRLIAAITWCLLDRSGWILDNFLRADLDSFSTEFGDVYETETGMPQTAGALTFAVKQYETVVRPMLVTADALGPIDLVVLPLNP